MSVFGLNFLLLCSFQLLYGMFVCIFVKQPGCLSFAVEHTIEQLISYIESKRQELINQRTQELDGLQDVLSEFPVVNCGVRNDKVDDIVKGLGQFTRNYTQTVKRAADNKRRYAPGWVHSTCLLRGFPTGAAPHGPHDFAEQSVVCYTLCRRCPENTVAAGEGKCI